MGKEGKKQEIEREREKRKETKKQKERKRKKGFPVPQLIHSLLFEQSNGCLKSIRSTALKLVVWIF